MAHLILSDKIYMTGLEQQEIKDIKQALTLVNPQYTAAKKFSRYNRIALPQYLMYYEDRKTSLSVPIGFDVSQYAYIESVSEERTLRPVSYPPFVLTLRNDQQRAIDDYIWYNQPNHVPQGLVSLPTGKGKSILGIYLAQKLQQRTLIIVHKDDLVLGWQKEIKECFDYKVNSGLIKAHVKRLGEQITIAMIQTLNRMKEKELQTLFDKFGLVICDEGHHVSASTYTMFGQFKSMYKLLLTATPERNDGLGKVMFFYAGDFSYRYEYTDNEKDILPVEVVVRESQVRYSPCITPNGNIENYFTTKYDITECELLENIPYESRPKVDYHIVDDYVVTEPSFMQMVCTDIFNEAKQGRSCVVFLSQKEHCVLYYEWLNRAIEPYVQGVVQLYYGDSDESNDVILQRAENKDSLITITTYAKSTEGTNVKAWEVAFLVSSLNNGLGVEQALGRIRRVKEGKSNIAYAYDYRHPKVYSVKNHGKTRDARYKELKFKVKDRVTKSVTPPVERTSKGFTKGFIKR